MIRPKLTFPLSLRLWLTLWYLLTLGLILLLFAAFLYVQLRHSLLAQMDAVLQAAATQAAANVQPDNNRLVFQNADNQPAGANFVVYLTDGHGDLWGRSGRTVAIPPPTTAQSGARTLAVGDDAWRVYSLPTRAGAISGWIQVMGDLDPIKDTLDRLLTLMLVGGPLALALAGLGGAFLAGRALAPIARITRTAQAISGSDLNRRLHYQGPSDEIGRLAATFDAMLDRLQAAFVREQRFTGDAAHELRTPLTALKGQIGVTLSQPRQAQQYAESLRGMEGQVDRLIRLSNDLLFMARLEQGQFARSRENIGVADLLGAVIDQVRPLADAKGITLSQTTPPGLTMQGDLDLLIRLFLNLLDNAVKFTPINGRIGVNATSEKSGLHIAVTDSGPGIAPEHLPHLFERFYRIDAARTRSIAASSGAGLGLSIAHEIARAHGGQIEVISQAGQGAIFTVVFPRQIDTS